LNKELTQLSKFLSYVLRHAPESIGLTLDQDGWADITQLLALAKQHGKTIDPHSLAQVVAENDKQRFRLSEDATRIRASQGHSTDAVALAHVQKTPPDVLYHGTATRFLDAIWQQGLLPGKRHHVHLSADVSTASAVGSRHGKLAILKVDAAHMHLQGLPFYQADNGVWLSAHVPVAFLSRLD
jgi:putative RNA 2'-phosphotransferase